MTITCIVALVACGNRAEIFEQGLGKQFSLGCPVNNADDADALAKGRCIEWIYPVGSTAVNADNSLHYAFVESSSPLPLQSKLPKLLWQDGVDRATFINPHTVFYALIASTIVLIVALLAMMIKVIIIESETSYSSRNANSAV